MKKLVIALMLTAVAGVSFAAMGAGSGLPQIWNMTLNRGYDDGATMTKIARIANALDRNAASSMCVECHTINPSKLMVTSTAGVLENRNDAGGYDAGITNESAGTHYVMNFGAMSKGGVTHTGGGWTGSIANARTDGGYIVSGVWNNTTQSKYGYLTGGNAFPPLTSGVINQNSVTTANAQLICESCHNIVKNTVNNNSPADNDYLLGDYRDSENDSICTACHAGDATPAGRQAFHTNDNLKNFGGSLRKFHHVMTGDSIAASDYPTDGVSGQMWAPSYTEILGADWCTPSNRYNTNARGTAVTGGGAPTFRGACNIAGSGTYAFDANPGPQTRGDIDLASATTINCSSCHRVHNARTLSGAHIFRGIAAAATTIDGKAIGDYPGTTETKAATIYNGITRRSDVAGAAVPYGEYRPLCLICHIGY